MDHEYLVPFQTPVSVIKNIYYPDAWVCSVPQTSVSLSPSTPFYLYLLHTCPTSYKLTQLTRVIRPLCYLFFRIEYFPTIQQRYV